MAENIYGKISSGGVDLSDSADFESAADAGSDNAERNQSPSPYKTQMMRSNIFLVVLFVGAAAAVYGLSFRKGPAEASAKQKAVESQVNVAILRISGEGFAQVKTPSSGQVTSKVLKSFYDQVTERQIPLRDLKKNPFVFVPTKPATPVVIQKPRKPGPIEKSPEEKGREEAMAAFKTLHLQSVMMGRNGGTAIISNNLLTVGQTIEGFRIKSISPRLVVLVRDKREFKLEMP